jgi:hypothetical protein
MDKRIRTWYTSMFKDFLMTTPHAARAELSPRAPIGSTCWFWSIYSKHSVFSHLSSLQISWNVPKSVHQYHQIYSNLIIQSICLCLSIDLSFWSIHLNLSIHLIIWVKYNNSLTWIKAIWGWFPLLTMIIYPPELSTSAVKLPWPSLRIHRFHDRLGRQRSARSARAVTGTSASTGTVWEHLGKVDPKDSKGTMFINLWLSYRHRCFATKFWTSVQAF